MYFIALNKTTKKTQTFDPLQLNKHHICTASVCLFVFSFINNITQKLKVDFYSGIFLLNFYSKINQLDGFLSFFGGEINTESQQFNLTCQAD